MGKRNGESAIRAMTLEGSRLLAAAAAVIAVALVPLYGILVPANTDLEEHILIAKLLWEKLAGVSGLDLEISTFLGYRLLPFGIAGAISIFDRLGIPLIYLPKLLTVSLIAFHAALIVSVMYFTAREKGDRVSYAYAVVVALPAVVAMYSSSWFMGFINFTLGLTLVVAAICLTEWFLRDGTGIVGALLFLTLLLAYTAHPFAPMFWILWCACRGVMSMAALNFLVEWKRLVLLPLFYFPVVVYHYLATKGTELEPRAVPADISPVVSGDYWLARMSDVARGVYLQADDNSSGAFFAAFLLALLAVTTVLTFVWGSRRLRAIMLTCIMFFLAASLLEERFVPTPSLHWLAYELRFFTVVALVCLTMSGVVLLRMLARAQRRIARDLVFGSIGCLCIVAVIGHLISVSRAYQRFDTPGREYTAKVLDHEDPSNITMPSSLWHPNGSFLSLYICLEQPDCNPEGTPFHDLGGDLYAVKIRTEDPLTTGVNDQEMETGADGETVAPSEKESRPAPPPGP